VAAAEPSVERAADRYGWAHPAAPVPEFRVATSLRRASGFVIISRFVRSQPALQFFPGRVRNLGSRLGSRRRRSVESKRENSVIAYPYRKGQGYPICAFAGQIAAVDQIAVDVLRGV